MNLHESEFQSEPVSNQPTHSSEETPPDGSLPAEPVPENGASPRTPDSRFQTAEMAREVTEALRKEAEQAQVIAPPRRYEGLEPEQVRNASQMLRNPGWLWRFVARMLFRDVAFEEKEVRRIREITADNDVVYVMNHQSTLDYLYFNYALSRFDLPLVFFGERLSMTVFRPWWKLSLKGLGWLFGRRKRCLEPDELLDYGLERGLPAMLFLRRRGLLSWSPTSGNNELFQQVLESQRARMSAVANREDVKPKAIHLVPQLLVWHQQPERYRRSITDIVFGDPQAPSRLRKAINFILHRRQAFVQLGTSVNLLAFLEEHGGEMEMDELVAKLRFLVRKSLSVEERVIQGPVVKDSKQLSAEILRTPEMRSEIGRLAEDQGRTTESVEKEIASNLKEMAANFKMSYVEGWCIALTVLLGRLYSEVIASGLDRVREAGREAPVVLLPCHRSHIDYLVLSWLFHAHGLIAPHIAAGINLAFFPLGHLFRHAGAFFLRRQFGGDDVYRVTFREYVRKLVREGFWVEFFPEGGRSRSGKMLPPKLGMLSIILDAIRSGTTQDVKLIPIYVGYEQVIEERSYIAELSGAEKEREGITGLLKTTKVLWSRYGRLYVSFGEPLSVRDALDDSGVSDLPSEHPDFQEWVRRMGYRVLDGIQREALVTPSSVTSMALLMSAKRGVHREELIRRIGFILAMTSSKKAPLSKTLEHAMKLHRQSVVEASEQLDQEGLSRHPLSLGQNGPVAEARGQAAVDAVDEVLHRYVEDKHLTSHDFGDAIVYTVVPERRIHLDYYKNSIVHLVMPETILAAAYHGASLRGAPDEGTLRTAAYFLSVTFKYEFVYNPDSTFDELFDSALQSFFDAGLLERHVDAHDASVDRIVVTDSGWAKETLSLLHEVLQPWLESYWLLTTGIRELLPGTKDSLSIKDFIRATQKMAQHRYQVGDVRCTEAASSISFKNAIGAIESLGYVLQLQEGRDRRLTRTPRGESDVDPIPALADRLRTFFSH
jgi:glycerol-3-phosphate O-acyltransferase